MNEPQYEKEDVSRIDLGSENICESFEEEDDECKEYDGTHDSNEWPKQNAERGRARGALQKRELGVERKWAVKAARWGKRGIMMRLIRIC